MGQEGEGKERYGTCESYVSAGAGALGHELLNQQWQEAEGRGGGGGGGGGGFERNIVADDGKGKGIGQRETEAEV
jgi:hypothetical protein